MTFLGNTRKASKKKKIKAGAPPGTLVYTGENREAEVKVIFTQYNEETINRREISGGEIPEADKDCVNWYDIEGMNDIALIEKYGQKFKIHPLVLEDVLSVNQRPKFEDYHEGLFILIKSLTFNEETRHIETEQIGFYVKENIVLTFQENTKPTFAAVQSRLTAGRGKIRTRGADYLAYALIDVTVDNYFVILEQIEDLSEKLEERILAAPDNKIKGEIHNLKLQMLTLRKSISPLREAVHRLSNTDNPILKESSEVFIRDLYDHTIQVMDMVDTYRDILNGLYDLYLSEISFKMNSVMQVLTIISTIFIPLTFLAGIYGMNFEHMPELHYRYSYPVFWLVMTAITISLIFYFRRKRWL